MLKRLDHVEIIPRDFERSLAFYTGVLGFTVDHRYPIDAPPLKEVAYLTLHDSAIELLRAENPLPRAQQQGQAGYRLMAWEVDDMEATLKDLAAKGVQPSWGPRRRDEFVRAEITDPDGNAIELRQWFKTEVKPRSR
jgi:glyoxylase I family protein